MTLATLEPADADRSRTRRDTPPGDPPQAWPGPVGLESGQPAAVPGLLDTRRVDTAVDASGSRLHAPGQSEDLRLARLTADLSRERDDFLRIRAWIDSTLNPWLPLPVGDAYLTNRLERLLPELGTFFERAQTRAERAPTSARAVRALERDLQWYRRSEDGRALLIKTEMAVLVATRRLATALTATTRTQLGEVHEADERFFRDYLNEPKARLRVFRGDGRGVTARSLDGYGFPEVPAGGAPDISFFGVVQHLETSTQKNGMVSTTTDRDQAKSWACDDHAYGIVFEFELTQYIDTIHLLDARNFKHRFRAQKEVLVPGSIPGGQIVSATLYDAEGREIKVVQPGDPIV